MAFQLNIAKKTKSSREHLTFFNSDVADTIFSLSPRKTS